MHHSTNSVKRKLAQRDDIVHTMGAMNIYMRFTYLWFEPAACTHKTERDIVTAR
jgi:hypothetical protein